MSSISLESSVNYLKMEAVRHKMGGISRTALWRLRCMPDFPSGVQLTPGLLVWNEGEIDQYLESRKVKQPILRKRGE